MRPEVHPWLKWPGCDKDRKIELNNRLAILQHRPVCPPRIMDWNALDKLKILGQIELRMNTQLFEDRRVCLEIPIWKRAFSVEEDCYKEWMMEFYSSIVVDKVFKPHELGTRELVHFRLGGVEHNCTLAKFGVLTGLLTTREEENTKIGKYLAYGDLDSREFLPRIDNYWYNLTGVERHNRQSSKVAEMRIPALRIISKMITYSFFHRSTQNDKAYAEDLWLMSYFDEGDAEKYVNAVWVLACFLEKKGAGRQFDSPMCCGHFITRIARSLGLITQANVRICLPPVKWKHITKHDLEASKLCDKTGTMLIEEGARPPVRVPGVRDPSLVAMENLARQNEFVIYHMLRYQPVWEKVLQELPRADGAGPCAAYAPPSLVGPAQGPSVEQAEEGSSSSDSEESESLEEGDRVVREGAVEEVAQAAQEPGDQGDEDPFVGL